jgi:RNA polymerase sigma-70 factor (ECF subfamily)
MSDSQNSFIGYYEQYKNKIFVYFLYRVNFNRTLAEDLTSEVFLKALKSFDGFDLARSFQSWIFAIAHNHLVNHYRVAHRETELLEDQFVTRQEIDQVDQKQELERVFTAINKMADSDREILLLRFVDQLSNTEIATLLEKDEGAVRTKMSRSLAKLREILEL